MQLARRVPSPFGTARLCERDLYLRSLHDIQGDAQTWRCGAADWPSTTPCAAEGS